MHVRRLATSVEVLTPAKINLFLEVLARRPDGFHEIETVMAAVTLCDHLVFTPQTQRELELHCRWGLGSTAADQQRTSDAPAHELLCGEIPTGPANLIWRAVMLIRNEASIRGGAQLRLMKRIPAAAGLGGASSDAAAALVAANIGWRIGWPRPRLVELAEKLGSDVPFFLTRGAAVGRGRGERIEPMRPPRLCVVIVRPPVGLSTPQVYKVCRPVASPKGVARLMDSLAQGDAASAGRQLTNSLEPAAASLTPWINMLRGEFERSDVVGHQMSGSGSSYFGLCRSARQARRVAARLRARGIGAAYAVATAVAG